MIKAGLGIVLVLALFAALLARLSRAGDRHHPETVRKVLHVGMGLTTLTFPWLFDERWPVLLLASLALIGLTAVRRHPVLRTRFGSVLTGVSRVSIGEFCFVLGTCAVFVLSSGDRLSFLIPMLILTFADAAAALIGTGYGRHYWKHAGHKTLEGSAAFLIVALLCTALPLALLTTADGIESVLTAVLVASTATLLEALAARGLDNLLVPVGAFAALSVGVGVLHPPSAILAFAAAAALIALMACLFRLWFPPGTSRPGPEPASKP